METSGEIAVEALSRVSGYDPRRVDASKFSYRNIDMYLYFNELCISKWDAHCEETYFRPR